MDDACNPDAQVFAQKSFTWKKRARERERKREVKGEEKECSEKSIQQQKMRKRQIVN